MKKIQILCLLLAAAFVLPLFSGCAAKEETVDLDEMTECVGPAVDLGSLLDDIVPLATLVPLSDGNGKYTIGIYKTPPARSTPPSLPRRLTLSSPTSLRRLSAQISM